MRILHVLWMSCLIFKNLRYAVLLNCSLIKLKKNSDKCRKEKTFKLKESVLLLVHTNTISIKHQWFDVQFYVNLIPGYVLSCANQDRYCSNDGTLAVPNINAVLVIGYWHSFVINLLTFIYYWYNKYITTFWFYYLLPTTSLT